ncbi:hypothetical protein Sste5346_008453 [Sporothrix stenoceras]|uniref:Peptidase S54 rhomboid domain-containing protein n=1 Tax=Sporothrix stenoceras TaxID=5173 RepID=A0ABR3YQP6_9PEZI
MTSSSSLTTSRTTAANSKPLLSSFSYTRTLFSASSHVTTQYVDLPPDYDDADGLPFRRRGGDLEPKEVTQVFGPGMSPVAANRLLRILHGRRVAGTLDDPSLRINTSQYRSAEIEKALAYLRQTTPVDELINAGLRAEDELATMEREQAEWLAKKEGIDAAEVREEAEVPEGQTEGKTRPPSASENKWRARLFREVPKDDVYGVGAFDVIRARNRAKNEIRERQRAEAEAIRRAEQEKLWAEQAAKSRELVGPDGAPNVGLPGVAREMSPRVKQYALQATSPLEAPPTMSKWQRLWPSYATVFALVVGGGVLTSFLEEEAATNGSESEPRSRLFPSVSASTATVLAIIGANIAVFAMWRIPPLWRLFNRYMIVVPATPRPVSLLGAMFSHQKAGHLLANVVFLWFIGVRLHDEIGRPAFLQTYFSSGLIAFLASLTNIVLRNNLHLTTLGASGAIYGITTAYFMLHKFDGFKILGLPPDPYTGIQGLGFIGLMVGLNLLTLRAEKQSIDVVTHFAGMAVGAVFGEYMRVQKEEKTKALAEGRPARGFWEAMFSGSSDSTPAASPEVTTPTEQPQVSSDTKP